MQCNIILLSINFRWFNAYKRYKVLINVKDEDSSITLSTEIVVSGCYISTELNSFFFLIQMVYEQVYIEKKNIPMIALQI